MKSGETYIHEFIDPDKVFSKYAIVTYSYLVIIIICNGAYSTRLMH